MHNTAYELGKWAIDKAKSEGYDRIDAQGWEDLKNCMEIVKCAICAEKDYKIIEAMKESDEAEKLQNRMGYNNRRYESGRYAPAGRGHMGYTPYMMEDDYMDEYLNNPNFEKNMRMGYPGGSTPMISRNDTTGGRYGYAYSMYDTARRHYTETHSEEDKMQMQNSRAEVMDNVKHMVREASKDATPEEKQKYKVALQQLIQQM